MPEPDIVEIFVDKTKILHLYIPASGQLFEIDIGREVDVNPYNDLKRFKLLGQYNLDELKPNGNTTT